MRRQLSEPNVGMSLLRLAQQQQPPPQQKDLSFQLIIVDIFMSVLHPKGATQEQEFTQKQPTRVLLLRVHYSKYQTSKHEIKNISKLAVSCIITTNFRHNKTFRNNKTLIGQKCEEPLSSVLAAAHFHVGFSSRSLSKKKGRTRRSTQKNPEAKYHLTCIVKMKELRYWKSSADCQGFKSSIQAQGTL